MKAAIVCRDFPPKLSGVGDYTDFVAREMASGGVDITVLTSNARGIDRGAGFEVKATIQNWDRGHIAHIVQQLQEVGPEVVLLQYVPHMYGRSGIALWIIELARRIRAMGVRLLIVFHELYYPWSFSKRLPIALIHRYQTARLVAISDIAVVTTSARQQTMRRWLPWCADKIFEVPVGSNIPVSKAVSDQVAAIRERYTAVGDFLIGGFGVLKLDERNFDLLFAGLAGLRRNCPNFKFLWIGQLESGSREHLRVNNAAEGFRVSDLLCWSGPLGREEVSRHLSSLDVFLALQDGGPCFRRGSLVAAMAHGLPIITLAGNAADPRLANGEHMMIVPGSADAVAESIRNLLLSPDLRRRLGQRAQEFHNAHLSWPVIAKQLIELLGGRGEGG